MNTSGTVDLEPIPFNRAPLAGKEAIYVAEAIANGHLSADGPFTKAAREWLERQTGAGTVLLVHSCTAALELSILLNGIGPGDEVIVPSYTFTSTANAVALVGATPVFVDVDPHTFNMTPESVRDALDERTRAIMPVHYAGVACDMDEIGAIAADAGVPVIEDAAQGMMASWRGRPLGAIGALGAYSFHETKNVTCGEGGALLVNDPEFIERAEILREKGTDRSRFFRGQVDKYTWIDIGSSYALSDLAASFLLAQLEQAEQITSMRMSIWNTYHDSFAAAERAGRVVRPRIGDDRVHNAHMYYLVLQSLEDRSAFISHLRSRDIQAVFHYVPLHQSPMGSRVGRVVGDLAATKTAGECLVRLPLWPGMTTAHVERVVHAALEYLDV